MASQDTAVDLCDSDSEPEASSAPTTTAQPARSPPPKPLGFLLKQQRLAQQNSMSNQSESRQSALPTFMNGVPKKSGQRSAAEIQQSQQPRTIIHPPTQHQQLPSYQPQRQMFQPVVPDAALMGQTVNQLPLQAPPHHPAYQMVTGVSTAGIHTPAIHDLTTQHDIATCHHDVQMQAQHQRRAAELSQQQSAIAYQQQQAQLQHNNQMMGYNPNQYQTQPGFNGYNPGYNPGYNRQVRLREGSGAADCETHDDMRTRKRHPARPARESRAGSDSEGSTSATSSRIARERPARDRSLAALPLFKLRVSQRVCSSNDRSLI